MRFDSKLIIILVLAIGIWGWKKHHKPKFSPEIANQLKMNSASLSSSREAGLDPCTGRSQCVYVYVAPWCGYCHQLLPKLVSVQKAWKDTNRPGLKYVIGMDSKPEIEKMAKLIDGPSFADTDKQFSKAHAISSVPHIMVVDANQQILASGSNGQKWIQKEMNSSHSKGN